MNGREVEAWFSFIWCKDSQAVVRECSLYASALLGLPGSLVFRLCSVLPGGDKRREMRPATPAQNKTITKGLDI
ncbi:hypothetical protein E2C01_015422 [Portunus trituberculatus]|uniref:Uncharacterized protein n=1 Tax=Portunus trituberculatus TaxID=210409 RepID=A0A5B7DMV0_PORTR|nr:hypothetical protein [Portunus trituberculatus]